MSIKQIIVISLLLHLFQGCNKPNINKGEVIRINPTLAQDVLNLSEIADSIKYIKLQSDSVSIIGRIHSIFIRERYIYVYDLSQQSIIVFDKDGKFVTKLNKQGKGPDEYIRLGPTIIDDNEEFIEIFTHAGEGDIILRYSNISFNLIEKIPIPRITANTVKKKENLYYLATQQIENIVEEKPTNASILIVKDGKIVKSLFDKTIITRGSGFSPNVESFTMSNENKLFVSIMYDNTFYELNNTNAYPFITIDFGNKGINNSIGNESVDKQLNYLKSVIGLASFPVLNINNSEIMTFSYYFASDENSRLFRKNPGLHQYLELKKLNKTFLTKKIKNDINGFPEEVFLSTYYRGIAHEGWYKDYIVDIVTPLDFLKNETEKYVEGLGLLTINDNPIIVLIKIKD